MHRGREGDKDRETETHIDGERDGERQRDIHTEGKRHGERAKQRERLKNSLLRYFN